MADQKVSDLPSLNGADVDAADLLYIIDSSAGSAGSKKITVGQYQLAPVSGGTANTVVYLNGSKVESSSAALTFDGSNLGIGTSSPSAKLHVAGNQFRQNDATNSQGYVINTTSSTTTLATLFGGSSFAVQTGASGTNQLLLDSSGNLGLGVTPSAWAGDKALQVNWGSISSGYEYSVNVSSVAYRDNATWKYLASSQAPARYEQISGTHAWFTAPSGTAGDPIPFTQAMTLDASGNLSVGTTAGGTRLQVFTTTDNVEYFRAGTSVEARGIRFSSFLVSGVNGAGHLIDAPGASGSNGTLAFATNSTERARITSVGDLLVGTTSNTVGARINVAASNVGLNVDAVTVSGAFKSTTSGTETGQYWNAATTGDNILVAFYTETVPAGRGTISYNRGAGLVAYNTTSDYRAKDIIGPVQNPGATIDALKVYEGVMKGATQSRPMLVAHEAQAVAPYCVTGEKDAVNEDGAPVFQQMDVSALVPLLLAEIQSLRARVAALESA